MNTQIDFFATTSELDQRFWDFHHDNPQVLTKLIEMSNDLKQRGRSKIGMKMLFEVIRWHTMLQTTDPDFKLNNSYTSRYVRLIEERRPDLTGLFEKRTIKS